MLQADFQLEKLWHHTKADASHKSPATAGLTQKQTPVTRPATDPQKCCCEPQEEVLLCQPSARHIFLDPFIVLAWLLLLSREDADF